MTTVYPTGPATIITPRYRRLSSAFSLPGTFRPGKVIPIVLMVGITLAAIVVPQLAPHAPLAPTGEAMSRPGTAGYVLGTDQVGRDMLSRLLFGFRSTWFASLALVSVGLVVGSIVGLIAGGLGGRTDRIFMRLADGLLAVPSQFVAISIVAALGPSLRNTVLALSIVWWAYFARIIRGEVRSLAARPHIEAARCAGVGRLRIGLRHLLPGALPVMVVVASLDIGTAVAAMGTLSFIGLGAPAPSPELGAMSAQGITYLLSAWWIPVLPGVMLFALGAIANLCGDAFRGQMADR